MLDLGYEHIVFNVLASLYSIALTQISDNLTLTIKCGIEIKTFLTFMLWIILAIREGNHLIIHNSLSLKKVLMYSYVGDF